MSSCDQVRLMAEADVPAAMALKEAAGWNQTEQDWRLLLQLQPDGCFVLEAEGRVVASATAYCYGTALAWIGMVLTLPEYRGRGFGNRVFLETVDFCRRCGVRSIKLDATDMGRPLYERAGFVAEYSVERWGGIAPAGRATGEPTRLDLEKMLEPDAAAFGSSRAVLLRALAANSDWAAMSGRSFALARPGTKAHYFGPCVAEDATAAAELFDAFLTAHAGRPVFVDVPVPNAAGRAMLRERGLEVRRTLWRMVLGSNDSAGDPARIFGLAGFEYG